MPLLNRIRFINFNVDVNQKHITDMTLNVYGENVLLKLANGGGKSCMTQLAHMPLMRRGSWNFANKERTYTSYFNTDPSFVIEEFIKDDKKEFITVGFMAQRNTSADATFPLNIIMFISRYSSECAIDLEQIVPEQDNKSFAEYKQYFEKLQIDNKSNFKIFNYSSESQKERYYKELSSYGLDINKFEFICKKINSVEGGMGKLYENTKSEEILLRDVFFPTIEKQLEKKSDLFEHPFNVEVEDLLEKLCVSKKQANEVIELEKEKHMLSTIINNNDNGIQQLLDKGYKLKANAAAIKDCYNHITLSISKINSEMKMIDEEIGKNEEKIITLEHEQKCNEYWMLDDKKTKNENDLEITNNLLNDYTKKKDEIELKISYNEAYEIFRELQDVRSDYLEVKYKKDILDNKYTDIKCKKDYLGYYIAITIDKNLKIISSNIESINNAIKKEVEKKITVVEKIQLCEQKHSELVNAKAKLEGGIIIRLKNIKKNNNCLPREDMVSFDIFDSVVGDSFKERIIKKKSECSLLKNNLQELRNQKVRFEKDKKDYKEHYDKLLKDIALTNKYMMEYSATKKLMDEHLCTIKCVAEKHKINTDDYFNSDYIINELDNKLRNYNLKYHEIYEKISLLELKKSQYVNFENGICDLPDNFLMMLDKLNITFEYGIKFINDDIGKNTLDKYPILRSSIIVDDIYIDTILRESKEYFIPFGIPILPRSKSIKATEDFSVNNIVMVSSSSESITQEAVQNTIASFDREISNLTDDKNIIISIVDDLKNSVYTVKHSIVDKDLYANTCDNIKKLGKNLTDFESEKDICEINIAKCEKDIADSEDKIHSIRDSISDITNILNILSAMENDYELMIADKKDVKLKGHDIDICIQEITEFKSELNSIEIELNDINSQLDNARRSFSNLSSEREVYANFKECSCPKDFSVPENFDECVSAFEAMRCTSPERDDIEKNFKKLYNRFKEKNQKLDKYISDKNLDMSLLENNFIPCDIELLRSNRDDILLKQSDAKNRIRECEKYINGYSKKLTIIKNSMNPDLKLISKSEIFQRDYEKAISSCKNNVAGKNEQLKKIKYNLDNFLHLQDKFETIANVSAIPKSIVDNVDFETICYKNILYITNDEISYITNYLIDYKGDNDNLSLTSKNTINNIINQLKNNSKSGYVHSFIRNITSSDSFKMDTVDNIIISLSKCNNNLSCIIEGLDKKIKHYQVKMDNYNTAMSTVQNIIKSYIDSINSELKSLAKGSQIIFNGKRNSMITFSIPKYSDIENEEKIKLLITDLCDKCSDLYIDNKKKDYILSMLNAYNLYDRIIGVKKINLTFTKVISLNTSYSQNYEEVRKNSNGEGYLTAFIIFCCLTKYSSSYMDNFASLMLWMDNPFSEIHSHHLLKPMFDIAKTNNIQLICMTAINDNTIDRCFNDIYHLVYNNMISEDNYGELIELKNRGKQDTGMIVSNLHVVF